MVGIGNFDFDALGDSCSFCALSRPLRLLLADGESAHRAVVFMCQINRRAAVPAADIKNMGFWL